MLIKVNERGFIIFFDSGWSYAFFKAETSIRYFISPYHEFLDYKHDVKPDWKYVQILFIRNAMHAIKSVGIFHQDFKN